MENKPTLDENPKAFLKAKWEGFAAWLKTLIIFVMFLAGPLGWLAFLGITIWLYHWGD